MPKIQKQLDTIRERFESIDAYIAREFGPGTKFSIIGDFCLVHMDNPSEEEIRRREDGFDINDQFPDDCPICEMQKEMGGFIVYDGEDDSGSDAAGESSDEQDLAGTFSRVFEWPEDRMWGRSYLNVKAYRESPPEIRVNMVFMHLWANVVELREDLGTEGANLLEAFSNELKIFLKPVQFLLTAPDVVIPWTEMKAAFDRARELTDRITDPSFEHKLSDFRQTLNLLGDSVQELIAHRSLLRN